jgi:hypothetical protein
VFLVTIVVMSALGNKIPHFNDVANAIQQVGMPASESRGYVEFIDGFEYIKVDCKLYRAPIDKPLVGGKRLGEFLTVGNGIEFALRMAWLQAG